MATFNPDFPSSLASHMVVGVLPVPPTVRLPTLTTTRGRRRTRRQPRRYKAFLVRTPRPYRIENGTATSHSTKQKRPCLAQIFRARSALLMSSIAVPGSTIARDELHASFHDVSIHPGYSIGVLADLLRLAGIFQQARRMAHQIVFSGDFDAA